MVAREVLLQLVPPAAGVVTLTALERLLVQMYPLVAHQVGLLHEAAPAHPTAMWTDAVVGFRVGGELVLFRGCIFAVWK